MAIQPDIEKVGQPSEVAVGAEAMDDMKNIVAHGDADMALNIYDTVNVSPEEISAVDHRKLVRKIDLHLIPIVSHDVE